MSTVLLVDDDLESRCALQLALESRGHHVAPAPNGRDALDKAKQIFPSLVLTDLQMPEMDGGELCRRLKSSPAFAKVPVILLSAVEEPAGIRCWDLFIRKPVEMPSLMTAVETLAIAYLRLSQANGAVDHYGGSRLRTINWRCWP
ncbi:response regulator [Paraburkholderia strydomiana]|uniref:response regulator n=1 Tax=Paraburkholderia strydomiana TaxID=1245417 RepID=UPI00286187C5|nr:response regulator [Paraburkholderia strydomiana]MDR7009997.1 CheY-like chemotaxis protein [Paraburkholderia strydomiana]